MNVWRVVAGKVVALVPLAVVFPMVVHILSPVDQVFAYCVYVFIVTL